VRKATVATVLAVLVFACGVARTESAAIFFCNYDVLLTVGDSVGSINSRARVRDGHVIPIEFQNHKIDILVAGGGDSGVEFAITLFEKADEHWYQVNPEPLRFAGELGIPLQYEWSSGGLSLDVAISVSSAE
jgi:hypothetical protein